MHYFDLRQCSLWAICYHSNITTVVRESVHVSFDFLQSECFAAFTGPIAGSPDNNLPLFF